jgi:hypothetical protein
MGKFPFLQLHCDRFSTGGTFLKQSVHLPGYGISYESLSFKTESETGIQNGAAIAGISRRFNRQTRAHRRSGSGGAGFETARSAETSGGSEDGIIHRHRQKFAFMTCVPTFQLFMQEFCVQEHFAHRIRPEGLRPVHDRCATIRGVHAELPEHGI